MFRIGHVHIRDDVHDSAVGLLGQTFVLAAVAGLHVEDGDVQTLGTYHGEAAVGVTKHQYTIGLESSKELVGAVDDVATGCTKVISHSIHIYFRLCQLQILEENTVEVVVVVLACVGEDYIEIPATLVDDCGKADNLRTCTDDDAKLQFAILLPVYIGIICFHFLIYLRGQKRYLGDWC